MRVSARFPVWSFDEAKFTENVKTIMGQVLRECAREWYRAAWPLIHVYRGMAQSELIPFGRFLKNVPTTVTGIQRGPWQGSSDKYPNGISPEAGLAIGESSFEIVTSGKKYYFKFTPGTPHWQTEWQSWQRNSLEAGRQAAQAYLDGLDLNGRLRKAMGDAIKRTVVQMNG